MKQVSLIVLLSLAAVCGCHNSQVYSVITNIDPRGWDRKDAYSLVYDNTDTISQREIIVFVRHDRIIAATSGPLVFQVATVTPDSLTFSEEWTFYPKTGGKRNWSPFLETGQTYRTNVGFMKQGRYVFTFSHNRTERLQGIRSIGMEIAGANEE